MWERISKIGWYSAAPNSGDTQGATMALQPHWQFAQTSARLAIELLLSSVIAPMLPMDQILNVIDQFIDDPALNDEQRAPWRVLRERALEVRERAK